MICCGGEAATRSQDMIYYKPIILCEYRYRLRLQSLQSTDLLNRSPKRCQRTKQNDLFPNWPKSMVATRAQRIYGGVGGIVAILKTLSQTVPFPPRQGANNFLPSGASVGRSPLVQAVCPPLLMFRPVVWITRGNTRGGAHPVSTQKTSHLM